MEKLIPDTKEIPRELAPYIKDAEQLIKTAVDSVNSFFISGDGTKFVGFLQDSLVDKDPFRISTGGLSIIADLYQISPHLHYLKTNEIGKIGNLCTNREEGRTYAMKDASFGSFNSSESFKSFHPLTYAVCAMLANSAKNDETEKKRAVFFNAINLHHFLSDGWTPLKNIDRPHPFIAYQVQNAIAYQPRSNAKPPLDSEMLKEIIDFSQADESDSKVSFSEYKPENDDVAYKKNIKAAKKNLSRREKPEDDLNVDALTSRIKDTHTKYRVQAEQYLLEQIGYAAQEDVRKIEQSPLYDPVGACFALNILLLGPTKESSEENLKKILGEHVSLVSRSVRHILGALTSAGTFPYGVPFSYNQNGTAGFTTSTNGLSALVQFLQKVLHYARRNDYPSVEFIEHLLLDNYAGFEKLFMLLSQLANSARCCDLLCGGQKLSLEGWSTDRAPNKSRVESWVTIEVLLFAIYLREVLQEYIQFFVSGKYSAKLPYNEPVWIYYGDEKPERLVKKRLSSLYPGAKKLLTDADEKEPLPAESPSLEENPEKPVDSVDMSDDCPIQFLHKNFYGFMKNQREKVADFEQKISSVLLFGPPGTAKTTTAMSLAQAIEWHYLELSPSNFIIDGLERVEQKAKEIFEELETLRETVILFDELDSLLIDREHLKPESIINFTVPAMLPKLQRLSKRAKKQRLLIVIATNFYDRLDPAMVRRGRIDKHLLVLPYNDQSRLNFLYSAVPDARQLLNAELLEEFKASSKLYVFEEMKAITGVVETYLEEKAKNRSVAKPVYPAPAVNPAIYWSRVPTANEQIISRRRSTKRLAIEVCEVVGRLLDEPRAVSSDSDTGKLIERLVELEKKLYKEPKNKQNKDKSGASDIEEWKQLCELIKKGLTQENKPNA